MKKNHFQKNAVAYTFGLLLISSLVPRSVDAEADEDILVVANNSVKVDSISIDEARAFFLKKRTSWKRGGKVALINAPSDSRLREIFRSKVLGMDWAHEQSYWQNEGIRKGLSKPAEFNNTLKAVFKLKSALSYVFRKDFKEGTAKVLLVIEN